MPKTFYARGTDGLVSIHEQGADFENPLSNLDKIYFNSQLDYLQIVQIFSGTLSLGTRANGTISDQMYTLGPHGLGYAPMVLGVRKDNGQYFCGDMLIFAGGRSSFRSLTAGSDTTYIYIRETNYLTTGGPSAPAVSFDYSLYLLGNPGL